jgi:hypothetical protein
MRPSVLLLGAASNQLTGYTQSINGARATSVTHGFIEDIVDNVACQLSSQGAPIAAQSALDSQEINVSPTRNQKSHVVEEVRRQRERYECTEGGWSDLCLLRPKRLWNHPYGGAVLFL